MLQIGLDQLSHRLEADNPWWGLKAGAKVTFRQPPRRAYVAPFMARVLEAKADRPLLLKGGLRAGKSILFRQAIMEIIRRGGSPFRLLYLPLSAPALSGVPLDELVRLFKDRFGHGSRERLFLFLDEVPFMAAWEQQIAALQATLPEARIVASLSSGRPRDEGAFESFVLPPLTFFEFLRFRGMETKVLGDREHRRAHRFDLSAETLTGLNLAFEAYINAGGYPESVVGEQGGTGPAGPIQVNRTFVRDHLLDRVLHKDLAGLHGIGDVQSVIALFALLARNTGEELGYEEVAGYLGLAKNTLRKYLDFLEDAFLIRRVARLDQYGARFKRQVAFKVHLTSPCLYAALFGPVSPDDPAFPRLVETAIAAQWLGADVASRVAYASWKEGRIDLVTVHEDTDRPKYVYEIDWQDASVTSAQGPETLVRFVERTNSGAKPFILTRTIARPGRLRKTDVTLVPAALYAYWLGEKRLG